MSRKKLINNSVIGLLQLILTATLTLVSVPVFINKLGLELYGIFAVVSVIGSLNLLTNLGLNGALLVYVAKKGKCRESDHAIVVTQFFMIVMMTAFITMAVFFKEYIVRNLFSIPTQYSADAEKLLVYLVFANALLLIGQSYTAVIDALQKIYLTNINQFIYSLIYWGGMITVVSLGGGLASTGVVALSAAAIWFVLVFIQSRYFWGKLNLKGLKSQFKEVARNQLSYGAKLYLSGMIAFLFEPLSKMLLSNFFGLHAVALFEIGIKIKGQINAIFSKALYPFLPFIANSQDNSNLKSKVFDFSKKIQLIVIPATIVMVFILSILTKLWLGEENYEQTTVFVITLTAAMLLFSTSILPIYQYLTAKNRADKTIWIQFSGVVVNAIIFISFYKIIGLYTILVSNTLAFFTSYIIGNYYQYKYLGAKLREEWYYYLKLIILGITCTSACVLIRYFVPISLWDLLIYPIVVGILFVLFVRTLKLINNDDMELYFGPIPFLKKSLSRILID